jgi:hypothetical protein
MSIRSLQPGHEASRINHRVDCSAPTLPPDNHRLATSSSLRNHRPLNCQSRRGLHKPRKPYQDLSKVDRDHDADADSYESEKRSRALQLAGEQLGFNLRLECYEPSTTDIRDWCEAQYTLFEDRPIFKDVQDIAAMDMIAQCFEVAPLRVGSGSAVRRSS